MLSKEEKSLKSYTNANGRTIYGECEKKCTNDPIPDFVTNQIETDLYVMLQYIKVKSHFFCIKIQGVLN